MNNSLVVTVAKIVSAVGGIYVGFLLFINALVGTYYVDDQQIFLIAGTTTAILLIIQTILLFINSSSIVNLIFAGLVILGTVISWTQYKEFPSLFIISLMSTILFVYVKFIRAL